MDKFGAWRGCQHTRIFPTKTGLQSGGRADGNFCRGLTATKIQEPKHNSN
ncbi:hypothetical protein SLEP1_g59282 [Rubroshorea leprosula]|uniref:Uncharacterized protein n=1 Tax=Rubroshorea leprosula TaxID=152421 RepID=A0AAV5MVF4_9ROSI|nr:hypothetical protein SLEP1_g59282 [Rubroshorea leprosula]